MSNEGQNLSFFRQSFRKCRKRRAQKIEKLKINVLIWKGHPRNNDLWNSFSLDLNLGVQMRWYLDWGSFRAWKTFSKILVNRCWLNIDIEASVGKKLVKNRQKGNCWPKRWGVFAILVLSTIFVDLRTENFCFFTTKSSYSWWITDNCIGNRVENQS